MNRRAAATAVGYRGAREEAERAARQRRKTETAGTERVNRKGWQQEGAVGVPAQERGSWFKDSGPGDAPSVVRGVAPGWEASPTRTHAKPICQRIGRGVVETTKSRTTVKETRRHRTSPCLGTQGCGGHCSKTFTNCERADRRAFTRAPKLKGCLNRHRNSRTEVENQPKVIPTRKGEAHQELTD